MSRQARVVVRGERRGRRGPLRVTAVSVVLASMLRASAASADDPVEIVWDAPAECPDLSFVREGVRRLAGNASAPRARAEAVVAREGPERWRVDIELTDGVRGVRTLRAESCDAAARAAALVIAIAVNPEAASRISQQLLEEPSPSEEPISLPPSRPVSPEARPEPHMLLGEIGRPDIRQGRLDLHVFAGGLAEGAVAPAIAPGALAGIGLHTQALQSDIEVSVIPAVEVKSKLDPGIGGRFELVAAKLRGCARLLDRQAALHGCAAIALHLVTAESFGATENFKREVRVGTGGLSLQATWPSHSLVALQARAGVAAPFTRPSFAIDNLETIYRPKVLGAEFAFQLVVTPAEWLRGRNVRR